MPLIVVDTNILLSSPLLRSPEWQSLGDHRDAWEIQFVVPEVVFVETVNKVRQRVTETQAVVANLRVGEFGVGELQREMADRIATYGETYEQLLRDRIDDLRGVIAPPPRIDYMDIVRRAAYSHPPYGGKDRDGFRDAVVWHTLISVAVDHPGEKIWFVSENTSDFGPADGRWTRDGPGSRDDCPILFHEKLTDELEERGIADRVQYVTKLARLEQSIASRYAPIERDDLIGLLDRIEDDSLDTQLSEAIAGLSLRPRDAALELDVTAAEATDARASGDSEWVFGEATRRGDAGWTARVTVDADVDIEIYRGTTASGAVTKTLTVAGDIAIGPDDVAIAFEITRVEALPADPMRAAWRRRDASQSGLSFGSFLAAEQTARLSASMPLLRNLVAEQGAAVLGVPKLTFGGLGIAEQAGIGPTMLPFGAVAAADTSGFLGIALPRFAGIGFADTTGFQGLATPHVGTLAAIAQDSTGIGGRTGAREILRDQAKEAAEEADDVRTSAKAKKAGKQYSEPSKPRKPTGGTTAKKKPAPAKSAVAAERGVVQDEPAAKSKSPRRATGGRKKTDRSGKVEKSGREDT